MSISFLGFVISPKVVAMEEKKIRAVLKWPQPTMIKELRCILGFANFYRHFIRGFSTVATLLTSMIKKEGSQVSWTPAAIKSFHNLKAHFTSAPIFQHPEWITHSLLRWTLTILASNPSSPNTMGLPLSFSQVCTSSISLAPPGLLAMKAAFKEWHHWLEGTKHPFLVLTDHQNLEDLCTTKRLNPRQARWALFFMRFDFSHLPPWFKERQGRCSASPI